MFMALFSAASASAAITKEYGWFESAAIEWTAMSGASDYNVYVKPAGGAYTQLDDELVRQYPGYFRADALGLKAGTYQMKVVPVDGSGNEMSGALESGNITVAAHDRSGFAHVGMPGGIGAYKNDGTLKDGAKVLYVWADNAKTVTADVVTSNKGTTTTGKGLQDIVYLYQKGYEKTPLAIRIIGTIKASDMDRFDSSAEGLQVKGKGNYSDLPITIEGVGFDAAFWGFGILCRNASDVEFRNFAIMLCMDDCLSLDTYNSNVWVHNMDFFYGNTGGDADQAKGDGTVDIKGKSKNVTVSYNHFIDCGKTSLGGMKSETTDCWMTFHHNWFDHSDSRHPRVRTAFYHVYNNYFRNCKYPMLISKQGTDAEGSGTFSGESGGVIKAYNNHIQGERKLQYWSSAVQSSGAWDAVLVNSRSEAVTATALTGGTGYNSSADQAARSTYIENKMEEPATVKATVTGELGAGRMQHGDFQWKFNNSLQDENYAVISELKSKLQSYKSTLIGFADGTAISNGGATSTVTGGDGVGISDEVNDSYVPSWAGGGGSSTVTAGKYVIGTKDDFFWFNAANEAAYNQYVSAGNFTTEGTFNPTREITNSKVGSCSDYIGSVLLPAGKSFTAYYADGIVSVNFYVSSNGSQKWLLEKSTDGSSWTTVSTVEGSTGGHPTCAVNVSNEEGIKYVRVTNQASGGRDIQGIKIATNDPNGSTEEPTDPADDDPEEPVVDERSNDATAEFTINGSEVSTSNNAYTLNVAYNASDAAGYTVTVTPAENATITSVSGAEGSNGTYTIAAPAQGKTATATFRILAENQTTSRTYTISIVKAVDPATIPVTAGEFLYFPTQAPSNNFYSVSGKYGDPSKYGSTTYTKNGVTYECTYSLKMESSTSIKFTPAKDGTVKIGMCPGYKATNLKLNGEKVAAVNNVIEATVTAGTEYTITKADQAGIFYIDLVYEGGTTPTPGPDDPTPDPDDPTPDPNDPTERTTVYDWSANVGTTTMTSEGQADGISKATVKVNNTATDCIKFGKSAAFEDEAKTIINDFFVAIKPANGGFKAGDMIHITGCINNKDASSKKGAISIYGSNQADSFIQTTEDFVNTYDTSATPVEQTVLVTKDCETLILTRSGNTATYILDLKVIRGEASAPDPGEVGINNVNVNANVNVPVKRIENGKLIIEKNGKTYNAAGAVR